MVLQPVNFLPTLLNCLIVQLHIKPSDQGLCIGNKLLELSSSCRKLFYFSCKALQIFGTANFIAFKQTYGSTSQSLLTADHLTILPNKDIAIAEHGSSNISTIVRDIHMPKEPLRKVSILFIYRYHA